MVHVEYYMYINPLGIFHQAQLICVVGINTLRTQFRQCDKGHCVCYSRHGGNKFCQQEVDSVVYCEVLDLCIM